MKEKARLFKTVFSGLGYIAYYEGLTVFFPEHAKKYYPILGTDAVKYPIILVMVLGDAYIRAYTRIPSLWKRFKDPVWKDKAMTVCCRDDYTASKKLSGGLSYAIGTAESIFFAFQGYLTIKSLLKLMGTDNDMAYYLVASYVAISNIMTFQSYNVNRMVQNAVYITNKLIEPNRTYSITSVLKSSIISMMGAFPFGARSYFLTKVLLNEMTHDRIARDIFVGIAAFAGAIGFFTSVLSQGIDVHKFITRDENKLFTGSKYSCIMSCKGMTHYVGSVIYALVTLFGFYISCLDLNENVGLEAHSWESIFLASLLSLAGTIMECAFNIVPLLKSLAKGDSEVIPESEAIKAGNAKVFDYHSLDTAPVHFTRPASTGPSKFISQSASSAYQRLLENDFIEESFAASSV